MNTDAPIGRAAWRHSPNGFVVFLFLSVFAVHTILRAVLFAKFGAAISAPAIKVVIAFAIGAYRDATVAMLLVVPLLFWLWVVPRRWFRAPIHRVLFLFGFFLFWAAEIFILFAEYYFFEEFRSRFNTVAVDYLWYPQEVAGNIWDSYPVPVVITVCVAFALVWVVAGARIFSGMWEQLTSAATRFRQFFLALALAIVLAAGISLNGVHASSDRTLNEIADNGCVAFVAAAWTRNLDYSAYYQIMQLPEAYVRVRRMLDEPGSKLIRKVDSIRRRVSGDAARPRLNVVILMEESFGSEFWGCLGRTNSLTPEMDKLATTEGLLFTNIYASGNRTVRGFEGILASFPPLPGDSVVKRDRSENVETIARVLKRDGYNTVFLYGGRGLFDSMRSFTLNNGYDRFLEHNPPFHDDFPHPNFATVWGVSDEEVYARGIEVFRALEKTGKPFLGTIMSVSNHRPVHLSARANSRRSRTAQTHSRQSREIFGLVPGTILRCRKEGAFLDEYDFCGGRRPRRARLRPAKHSHPFL